MTNPNKAELRRLAEDAEGSFGQFDPSESEQEFMARITPTAVLSLLNSEAQAKCEAGHAIQQKDAAYAECKALRAERDAALAELAQCRADSADIWGLAQGRADTIDDLRGELEACRKDAERYRWLRMADWWSSPLCVIRSPKKQAKPGTDCPSRDRLDSAIDESMSQEANHA